MSIQAQWTQAPARALPRIFAPRVVEKETENLIKKRSLLLLEPDEFIAQSATTSLRQCTHYQYQLDWNICKLDSPHFYRASLASLCQNDYELYLISRRLGPVDGLQLAQEARDLGCSKPIILVLEDGDYDQELKASGFPFLLKSSLAGSLLSHSVAYALDSKKLEDSHSTSSTFSHTTKSLLRSYEIEGRSLRLHEETLHLEKLMQKLLKGPLSDKALEKKQRLVLKNEEALSPLTIDPIQFEQMSSLLLKHIINSAPKNDVIRCHMRRLQHSLFIGFESQGDTLNDLEWQSLFSSKNTHGLFIVERLISSFGGKLLIDSSEEHGRLYSVLLPIDH